MKDPKSEQDSVFLYRRDGDNIDIKVLTGDINDQGGFDEGQEPEFFRRTMITPERWWTYESSDGVPPRRAWMSSNREKWIPSTLAQLGGLGSLEGYLADDQIPVTEILAQAQGVFVHAEMEAVDGRPCYVVEGQAAGRGKYTLWLDPEAGYLPRRAEVIKQGDDFWQDKAMSSYPPRFRFSDIVYSMTEVIIEEIEPGILFPVSSHTKRSMTRVDGTSIDYEIVNTHLAIDLKPDFAAIGAFEPVLAEGARIIDNEFLGLSFVWKNGQVQPFVELETMKIIDETVSALREEREAGSPKASDQFEDAALNPVRSDPEVSGSSRSGVSRGVLVISLASAAGLLAFVFLGARIIRLRKNRER